MFGIVYVLGMLKNGEFECEKLMLYWLQIE